MQTLHFKPGCFTWNKKTSFSSNYAGNRPGLLSLWP